MLGVGHAVASALAEAGLLPTLVEAGKDRIGIHVIERGAVEDLLRRLEPATPGPRPADASPLPAVAPRGYASVVEAVRWALDGKLPVVGVEPTAVGLRTLLVRPGDLSRVRNRERHGGLSVNEVAARLRTNWAVVRQLVALGHLMAREEAGA